ncbi:MAG: ribosome biogenesis GTPase Der [Holosporales bacterium]|jgi:GTP-binding protein|nr:ribosome biogenesis GTPase Der [Holosporales bacterium]
MFKVAIIGRTNVGKSTLFNRLSRSRDAITFDRHGVTVDLREKIVDVYDKKCILIDTPGMFDLKITEKMLKEVIREADVILFVIDGMFGMTGKDTEISNILRKSSKKKVILVVNKSEKKESDAIFIETLEIGFENNVQISAEHGSGIEDLLETLFKMIPENNQNASEMGMDYIKIAIIGRPNVGKSTIVNQIIKEDRRLVADISGLTRESCDINFEFNDRRLKIMDTPGVRKKAKISDHLEKISVANTQKAYKEADVVILVIDASTFIAGEIERQDLLLASQVIHDGKPILLTLNKVDLTPYAKDESPEFLRKNIQKGLHQLKHAPFIFTCGESGENIDRMLLKVLELHDKQKKKIKTVELNKWLSKVKDSDILRRGSSQFKLKYMTQISTTSLKFLIFCTKIENIKESHKRFLTNHFKKQFNLEEIPVDLYFRAQNKR